MAEPPVTREPRFLSGQQSWARELAGVATVGAELLRGMRTLRDIEPAVTVFGSARFGDGHPYYALARRAGELIAREGFTVMTGGGPGIMEAANRGAKEAGGRSVGCNIALPHEQRANPVPGSRRHVLILLHPQDDAREIFLGVRHPARRLRNDGRDDRSAHADHHGQDLRFSRDSHGHAYWRGFDAWVRETLVAQGAVSPEDLAHVRVVDTPEQVRDRSSRGHGELGSPAYADYVKRRLTEK